MYSYQSQHPDVTRASVEARFRSAPPTGIRRSARLISIEIRRSRHAEHSR